MYRFFVENIEDDSYFLSGDEFVHLAFVLRARVGDDVILCRNDGIEHFGKVVKIQKDGALIDIYSVKKSESEAKIHLTLFQAVAKGDKLEMISQKITELGANRLELFSSKYTNVKAQSVRTDRLIKISKEAAKQCGRARFLEVGQPKSFENMLLAIEKGGFDAVIFAFEGEKERQITTLARDLNLETSKKIALVVGAEGGFSPEESQKIINTGAISVSLGKRILRLETAAIACSALLLMGN